MNYVSYNFKYIDRIIVLFLVIALAIMIIARVINYYNHEFNTYELLLSVISVLFFMLVFTFTKWLNDLRCINNELFIRQSNNKTMEDTLKLIREERHDFINHLQCIYALMLTDKHNQATEYLSQISSDCRFNSQVLSINNSLLGAIIQNKKQLAEIHGINLKINVSTSLERFNLKQTAITTIFGNLLDNAIEILKECDDSSTREILFQIEETNDYYCFLITDTGFHISNGIIEKMFDRGYSTKGNDRGYGLWLVKNTVEAYGGRIIYDQSIKKVFNVMIPKIVEHEVSL